MAKQFKLYDSLHTLPLSIFIECVCDNNLDLLVISGKPSQKDIEDCWFNLWYQYVDLNEDNEGVYILQLKKEVALLNHKIAVVDCAVLILRSLYVTELVKALKEYGITGVLKPSHPEYSKSLDRVLAIMAPKKLSLQIKMKEVEDYETNSERGIIDRSYFDNMINRISKFQKYDIDPNKLMTSRFVLLIRDYLRFVTSKQKVLDPEDA